MIVKQDKFLSENISNDEENERHRSYFKVKSRFQIMYYHATHGRHKTQTHVMNARTVYGECQSREMITAFNKQCMRISYKSIKSQRSNLGKLTVFQNLLVAVPLSIHFDTKRFTIVALDSSDNASKNSLSGAKHAHDFVIIVFQVKPSTMKYVLRCAVWHHLYNLKNV